MAEETISSRKIALIWGIPFVFHFIINPLLLLIYFPNSVIIKNNTLRTIIYFFTAFSFSIGPFLVRKWFENLLHLKHKHKLSWLWDRQPKYNRNPARIWYIVSTSPGIVFIIQFSFIPLVVSPLPVILGYLVFTLGMWSTSGKDPFPLPKTKDKQEITATPELFTHEENIIFIRSMINKFYESYHLQIIEYDLTYFRWWKELPLRFEVTTGFLELDRKRIKEIVYQELARIEYFDNKFAIYQNIIIVISIVGGYLLKMPSIFAFYFVNQAPIIILFSLNFYLFLYLKYILMIILPIMLFRVPNYYSRYYGELKLFDRIGIEEWKELRKEAIKNLELDPPLMTKWSFISPSPVMMVKYTINKRKIDINDIST